MFGNKWRDLYRKVAKEHNCDYRDIIRNYTHLADIVGVTGSECDPEEAGRMLNVAARLGSREVAKVLLAAGADVRVQDDPARFTPLHTALTYDNPDIAEIILDSGRGGNDILDRHGDSCLHLAVRNSYLLIVKKLLFSGVNPNVGIGVYPLEIALWEQRFDMARVIVAAYAWRGIAINWGKLAVRPDHRRYCIEQLQECYDEIRRMKQTMLPTTSLSYYDLTKACVSKLALCLEDEGIRNVLRQDKSRNFPNYAELLDSRLRRAEKSRILHLQFLEGFAVLSKRLPLLSRISIDIMVLHLSEQDMRNFVGAFKF